MDQILLLARPVSARFQGITAARACLLIYCAKHRFISETAGYTEYFIVSHTGLPSLHQPTRPYSRFSRKVNADG